MGPADRRRQTVGCAAELSETEVTVLNAFATQHRIKPPANLGDAVRLVARLGGYLGRNNDPPPGHQVMWKGYTVLQMLCLGFSLRPPDTS